MKTKVQALIVGAVVALGGFAIYVPSVDAHGGGYEKSYETSYSSKDWKKSHTSEHKKKYSHEKNYENKKVKQKKHKAPKPVYSCDSLSAHQTSRSSYEFTASGTGENGAVITGWEYDFGDGTIVHGDAAKTTVEHTYTSPGTYTATAMVEVGVDGTFYGERSEACRVSVTVEDESCAISGKESLPKDDPDCKKVPVVHTVSTKPTPTPPAPKAPAELPETGIADVAMSSLGLGSLVGAGYYYIGSRRMVSKLKE